MDRTDGHQDQPVPLATIGGGGGCGCGCCGPAEGTSESTVDREQEIAELKELRAATERRLAELDAE